MDNNRCQPFSGQRKVCTNFTLTGTTNLSQNDIFLNRKCLSPLGISISRSHQTPTVYMTSTREDSPQQVAIPFSDSPRSRSRHSFDDIMGESFGIYSCRFSADGNEVVAGGNGKIFGLCPHEKSISLPHLVFRKSMTS